jgi:hypothetical protein
MGQGQTPGLDAREASAALAAGTADRLRLGFARIVEAAARERSPDDRDEMISLAPFVDCARRLGLDPATVLGPVAAGGPPWFRDLFDRFVVRTDVTLGAFGWTLAETPDGPAYRFGDAASDGRPTRRTG